MMSKFIKVVILSLIILAGTTLVVTKAEGQRQHLREVIKTNDKFQETVKSLNNEVQTLKERNAELQKAKEDAEQKLEQTQNELETVKKNRVSLASRGNDLGETFKATAYTESDSGMDGRGITKTGTKVREGRTIAVDPRIIPLGSKLQVYCESYPEINGVYIAEDTGSAIKGRKLDIYMRSKRKSNDFGIRDVTVTIVGR